MKFSIVVALAEDSFGIGFQNKLPWRIPGEIKYFKYLTTHTKTPNARNVVVMGRKTWESIPPTFRPLKARLNVVISSQPKTYFFNDDKCTKTPRPAAAVGGGNEEEDLVVCNSLESTIETLEAMQKSRQARGQQAFEKLYLIGGASLYHQALRKNLVDELYVTFVKGDYKVDTFFPLVDLNGLDTQFVKVRNDFISSEDASKPKFDFDVEGCSFEKYVLGEKLKHNVNRQQVDPKITVLAPVEVKEGEEKVNDENINSQNIPDDQQNELDIIKREIEKCKDLHEEYQYLSLVLEVIMEGNKKMDRTQTGTHSVFGRTMRFSLQDEVFPLLTTKTTFFRGVAEELLFFVSGKTDNRLLQEKKVHIWDLNCTRDFLDKLGLEDREEHDLGPVYGFQWRHFGADYTDFKTDYTGQGVDQLKQLIETIKTNPSSRRLILSAWNVKDLPKMVLPPCHMFAQFYVHGKKLSCQMYQRSADLGLGVPFNIASYALLTRMIAQCCGLEAHEFVHVIGDCHVYNNHVDQLLIQLKRKPKAFPLLKLNPSITEIDDFKYEDLELVGYKPHKRIKMKMAV